MRSLLWAAVAALLAAAPVVGQSNVELELQTGFRGAYRAPSWVPFRLYVQNLGPAIRGTLTVEAPLDSAVSGSADSYARLFRLDLARSSSKAFSFTLPIPEGFSPLHVVVESGGEPIVDRSIDLPRPVLNGRIHVVMSRQPSLDFLIALDTDERIVPVYPLPEQLPESWPAYGAVETVVVHNADLTRLTRRQVAALENWVRSGGLIVVLAGAELSRSSAELLSEWIPFRFHGSVPLPDAPVLATRFTTTREGELLFEEEGVRAVQAELGRGTVRVLNVDPRDLARLDMDSEELWRQLFSNAESAAGSIDVPIAAGRQELEQPLLSGFLQDTRYSFPPRWVIFLAAALYVVALWLLLRRLPRLAALFAVAAAVAAVALRAPLSPPPFAELQIEQFFGKSSSPVGSLDSDVVVFGTAERSYEVTLPPESIAVPLQNGGTTLVAEDILRDTLTPWRVSNHLGKRLQPSPVRIRRNSGTNTLSLFNRSTHALAAGVLIADGRFYATGPVAADTERSVALKEGRDAEERASLGALGLQPYQKNALSRIKQLQGSLYPEPPLFVGWLDGVLAPATVSPEPLTVGTMSIIIVELPQEWFTEGPAQ